jgi:hypothetical protein
MVKPEHHRLGRTLLIRPPPHWSDSGFHTSSQSQNAVTDKSNDRGYIIS